MAIPLGLRLVEKVPKVFPVGLSLLTVELARLVTHALPEASMAIPQGRFPTVNVLVVVGSGLLKEKPPGIELEVSVNPVD